MTNGDKIRAMSDEALAELLWYHSGFDNCPDRKAKSCEGGRNCYYCWLGWMTRNAEEESEIDLEVGDEIRFYGTRGVVVFLDKALGRFKILWENGAVIETGELRLVVHGKTGRHFPQIAEVLEAMPGG